MNAPAKVPWNSVGRFNREDVRKPSQQVPRISQITFKLLGNLYLDPVPHVKDNCGGSYRVHFDQVSRLGQNKWISYLTEHFKTKNDCQNVSLKEEKKAVLIGLPNCDSEWYHGKANAYLMIYGI